MAIRTKGTKEATRPADRLRRSSRRPQKVLVIDDDPALRRLIRILGREIGIDVVVASNGEEGLELVQAEQPDAIVLDLVMPVMDGRRFYSELRARNIDTPVLILSAYSARTAKHELRAEAYLEKPFEPEELLAGIQRLVK